MCAHYWNLTATFTCPSCGSENEDANLQTHFGDGYCTQYYRLGEAVPHLGDMTIELGDPKAGHPDDFIAICDDCSAVVDFAARIEQGRVSEVWPYHYKARA